MTPELFLTLCFILLIGLGATFVSFRLSKYSETGALQILWGFWVAFTIAMFIGMEVERSWDSLPYLFALLVFSVPAGVGGLIGTLVGKAKRQNAGSE